MQPAVMVSKRSSPREPLTTAPPAPPALDSIASQIAAHAASAPGHAAVVDGATTLSFRELDLRANRMASMLIEAGAGPECCVGLYFDRSADFVVAALAVLKAGAAYLPLDSSTPADRAAAIMADAAAPLVLTHRSKTRNWPKGSWRVVDIDAADLSSAESPCTAVPTSDPDFAEPSDDSLAYVIYTSGSSGRPKGVEITRGNLLIQNASYRAAFEISSADRGSHLAGLGFDASILEIWPLLTAGATLYIADESTRQSPQRLCDWLVEMKITFAFVPTILAEQLLQAEWPPDASLRTMVTGGDVLHRRPPPGLPFVFFNNYGPTECTVLATSGIVAPHADVECPPSIGRPIRNASALILDGNLRPVPSGEAGELCLAGPLVGRGYRNLPELTADRFVMLTIDNGASQRVYRTGDRVRLLPNGEIAFLGRLDEQIKIRGYRIEPGEVVAWLDRYPGVEASAVAARDLIAGDHDAGKVLVAWIIPAGGATFTAADLRGFLAAQLPDYMIPERFVVVAELPLTANGKLDKAALPPASPENLLPSGPPNCSGSVCQQAPSTDGKRADEARSTGEFDESGVRQQIGALVASLLDQPSVAATENFFMIGGHSMLGVQLVARIRDLFGVKLTLRQLFSAPTVAALSDEVARLLKIKHD